jgi:hypothetical protein
MTTSKNKLAALGFAAAVLAGGATGVVLNATGSAGATAVTTPATSTDDGTTDATSTLDGDRSTRLKESLQSLVDSGALTQEQLDQVISTLEANRPERGVDGGRHGRGGWHLGKGLDTVATTIGITVDELRTGLQSGQTIAEIAVANGSSAQAVIDALVADATERITELVNNTPQPGERPADAPADDATTDTTTG